MTIGSGPFERPETVHGTDDEILWRHPTVTAQKVDSSAFARFANIQSAEDVARFAQLHGVLRICEHGKPASHSPQCKPLGAHGWFREPASAWLDLAARARGILAITGSLRHTRPGNLEDWVILGGPPGRTPSLAGPDNPWGIVTGPRSMYLRADAALIEAGRPALVDPKKAYTVEPHPDFEDVTPGMVVAQVADERRRIARVATAWLQLGGAAIEIAWDHSAPQQVMTTHGLMGALAAQLAACLTGGLLVPCSECSSWAKPPHRRGERAWCERCRDTGRSRAAAARDYRARRATLIPHSSRGS